MEFYSIKVQDGPLTSRLQHLKLLLEDPNRLVRFDAVTWSQTMIATGTGIAPFASLIVILRPLKTMIKLF